MSLAIVVDDEHDLAVACERLLTRGGWQVTTVGSRGAALDALSAGQPPQRAVVDRNLPDGDGVDVIRAARACGARVIVISGQTSRTNRDAMLAEGAAGFLGKPFTARQFLDLVRVVAGEPLQA